MPGIPRRLVTIWKNRAEELFKSPLLKKSNLCFFQFAHGFAFSWLFFQSVKIMSPVLCCPLASTGIGEKKSICVRIHWCNEYPLPSVQFSPSSSCTMQKFSGQMAQARNYLNPVFKFSVLRYAGQYSVPSLLSCPMTWSTVQVFRMDSLYLLVYNIQNNKSVLPVFHPSFVINSLVSLSLCQCPCRAFLKAQWCLLLISMSFPILYHY